MSDETAFRNKISDFFTLEPQVLALFVAVFILTLGEQMWAEFFPVYFIKLGGTVIVLSFFKVLSDLLEAVSQLPGGIISDRLGRINTATLFIIFGIAGYLIYALAPSWEFLFLGLFFVIGTSSLLQPTIFSIIGDRLPPEKRTNAFSIQSILKRIPIIIAPAFGGFLIASLEIKNGVRIALFLSVLFGLVGLYILRSSKKYKIHDGTSKQWKIKEISEQNSENHGSNKFHLPSRLIILLIADILVRFGSGMVKVLLVLHVTTIVSYQIFGLLISLQMTTAILSYLPAAAVVQRIGRKPVIIVSFICFALYPSVILFSTELFLLMLGYFFAGFREFGEPARKALIVDLCNSESRGTDVGIYYTIRTFSIVPSASLGGVLWLISPQVAGLTASFFALMGLFVLVLFVHEPNKHN